MRGHPRRTARRLRAHERRWADVEQYKAGDFTGASRPAVALEIAKSECKTLAARTVRYS